MSDNDPLSPLETSSMDFQDQPTDVVMNDSSSSSSSTTNDDGNESGNISLSGLRAVCERRGPMRPQRTGYIPPARRSSTGTSAALLTEDDDESADDAGLTEADFINVAQRIMEKNPMVPLPESSTSSYEDASVSRSSHVLMPPPPVPTDAAVETDHMSVAETEDEGAAGDAAEISVSSSASSRQATAVSKQAMKSLGSQESLFSAVGHVSHGQSQRSAWLRTSTPGVTVGRESNLLSSSQLDVSAIPQASFSTSLPSSNEGLADESTREISSRNSNSRPQRPGSSFGVQRRLTFDGSSKSSEEGVVEPTESGLQSIAEENPLERSNTGTLSFIEGGIIDDPIIPLTTTPTDAVGEEEPNPPDILETQQGGGDEEEEVARSESQCSIAGFSSDARVETASTGSTDDDFMRRLAIAQNYCQSRNLQVLDELPVDSLATTAIQPNKLQTIKRPNLQPVVASTKNDREVAEAHKKKGLAASSSQRPGAAAPAAEDSPASESRFDVGKRFVRKRKTNTSGTSSSQGKAPSEIYGSVISVLQMVNSSQSSQASRVGSLDSQNQQQQSQSAASWRQSQPLPSIEEPPIEDEAEMSPPHVQIEPETVPGLIAGAAQVEGDVVTPASNSARKSSHRKSYVEQQTPTTARGGRKSLVEQMSIGSTESLFPQKIGDPTPKRQSGAPSAAGKSNATVEDEGGRAEGGGEEDKRKDRSRDFSDKSNSNSSSSPKDRSHRNVSRGGSIPLGQSGRNGDMSVKVGDHRKSSSGGDRITPGRTSRNGNARRERAGEVGGGGEVIPSSVDVINLRRSHLETKSPRLSRRSLIEPRDSSSSDNESSLSRRRKSHSILTRDDNETKKDASRRGGSLMREAPREAQQLSGERASDPGVATLRRSHLESKSPRMSRRSLIEYKDSEDDDDEQQLPLPHKSRPGLGNADDEDKTSKKLSAGKELPNAAQKSSGEKVDRRRATHETPKKLSVGREVPNAGQRSSGEISRDPEGGSRSIAGNESGHRAGRRLVRLVESSSSDNDDGFDSPRKSRLFPLPSSVAASRVAESSSELEVTERSRPSRRQKRSKSQIMAAKTAAKRVSSEARATVEKDRRQSSKNGEGTPGKSARELPARNQSQSHSRSKTVHEDDVGEGSQRGSSTFVVPTQVDRMSKTSSRSSSLASKNDSQPPPLALLPPVDQSARLSRSRSLSSARSDTTLPIITRKPSIRQPSMEDVGVVEEPDANADVEMNAGSDSEDADHNEEVRVLSVVASSSGEESQASDEEEGPVGQEDLQSVVASHSGGSSKKSSSEEQRSSRRDSVASSNGSRGNILTPKDSSKLPESRRVTERSLELLAEESGRGKIPSRAASNQTISKSSTTKSSASATMSNASSTKSRSSVASESLQTPSLKRGAVIAARPSQNVARKSVACPAVRSSQSSSNTQRSVEDKGAMDEPEVQSDVEMKAGSDAEDSGGDEEVRVPSVAASSSSSEESQASDEEEGPVGHENLKSAVATHSGRSSKKSSSEEQRSSSRRGSVASSNGSRGKILTPKGTSQLHGSRRAGGGGLELLAKALGTEKTSSTASNKTANRSSATLSSTLASDSNASARKSSASAANARSSVAIKSQQPSPLKKGAVKATRPTLNVARKSVVSSVGRNSQSSSNRSKITSDESRRLSKESTGSNRSVPPPTPPQPVESPSVTRQTSLVSYSDSDHEGNEDEVAPVAASGMLYEQMDAPVGVADEHYSNSSSSSSSSDEEEPISRASQGKRTAKASEDKRNSRASENKRTFRASEDKRTSRASESKQTSGAGERVSVKGTRPSLVAAKKSVVVVSKKNKVLSPRQSNGGETGNEKTGRQTRGSKRREEVEELRKKERDGRKVSGNIEHVTRASNESTQRGHGESSGSEDEVWDEAGAAEAREISLSESNSHNRKRRVRDDDSEPEEPFVPPVVLRPSRASGREGVRSLTQSPRRAGNLSQRFDSVIQRNKERQGATAASRPSIPEEPVASTSRGPRRSIAEEPVAGTSKGRTGARSKTAAAATASATTAKPGRKRGPKPPPPIPKKLEKVLQINNCITEHIVRCRLEALDMEMSNAKVREVTAHLNLQFEEMLTELQSKTLREQGMFSYRELEQALWNRDLLYRRPDGRSSELLVFFAHVLNHDDFKRCQKSLLIPKGVNRDTEFI